MSELRGACIIAQSGGPTAVINASALGVIRTALDTDCITRVLGAAYGIKGVLEDKLYDMSQEDPAELDLLQYTPSSALGSCRYKLADPDVDDTDYKRILEIFEKYNVRYFFYNGGNDSMDTCNKIYNLSVETGYELRVIGIPKTIDNDLAVTDHCPGFGSAAKYAAVSALELAFDASALPIHVVVMEMMGRNAGWITAASALYADLMPCEHLVSLPEVAFDKEKFLAAVKEKWAKGRGLLVTISEGIHYADGSPVADSGVVDGFGHKVPGGAAQALSDMIMQETGLKSRSEKPGLLGRVSVALMSEIDQKEAEEAGACAVRSAVEGKTGFMVGFETTRNPYSSKTILIPLEKVANAEKKFPLEWIGEDGASIKPEFKSYCEPLLGAYDSRFISLR